MSDIWPPEGEVALIEGMPEEEYHAHPALSASGMKLLLRSPLHFKHAQTHREKKKAWDVGTAIHTRVFGVGQECEVIPDELLSGPYRSISSNAAKAHRDDIEDRGLICVKQDDYDQIVGAADAVLSHPEASALLALDGYSEVSLFALDPETGVPLRGRLDRLAGGLILDLKTTTDVRPDKLRKVIQEFGYDVSAEVYRLLVRLVLGIEPEPMTLIFVEKEAPFEVRVVRLGPGFQETGRARMREAIELFQSCVEFDVWPGADGAEGSALELEPTGWFLADVARLIGGVVI